MVEPFADASWDTFGLLKEAFLALDERFAEATAEVTDVDRSVVDLLIRVVRSPDETARPTDLAADLSLVPSRITRCLDDAEQRGFIVRVAHPDDRRSRLVQLAPAGRALLVELEAPMRQTSDEYIHSVLDARTIAALEGSLRTLRNHARLP